MSIIGKLKQRNTDASQSLEHQGLGLQSPELDNIALSKTEIELLLTLIRESTFKGEYVETLYSMVYKLQQQHQNQ